MKMVRRYGVVIVERDDGTYKMTGPAPWNGKDARWEKICDSFCEAGSFVFEMADNNDQGRELNHLMCEKFGKVFYED